ncbi:MAG: DUF3800 domain-containing protein [Verrucomicrobiales bacterium]|nr:DUF3800 domain-containing protein [Verrucomicrobiales bacterium]
MDTVQNIYFDESGYTGNNLLHESQEYFAYGSVASNSEESREFVEKAIKDFRIQSSELKGGSLVRSSKGRRLVDTVFEQFEGRLKVSLSNKRFALSCKCFEYIFEPCLSEANSIFYGIGFHEFIANLLYLEFKTSSADAEEIFSNFEKAMRSLDGESLSQIFPRIDESEGTGALAQIAEFAKLNHKAISSELDGLEDSGVGKWILDLSNTSLYTLLANWGTEHGAIRAICDESQPLLAQMDIFNLMVDREGDQIFTDAFGKSQPMTFNLSEPILFADSKIEHGIQIADVVSAAFIHAVSNPEEAHAMKWRSLIPEVGCYGSIWPDFDLVDLTKFDAIRNALLLHELCERTRNGSSLTDGIGEFLHRATLLLRQQNLVEQGVDPNA